MGERRELGQFSEGGLCLLPGKWIVVHFIEPNIEFTVRPLMFSLQILFPGALILLGHLHLWLVSQHSCQAASTTIKSAVANP